MTPDTRGLSEECERVTRRMVTLLDGQFETDSHWLREAMNARDEDAPDSAFVFAQALASNRHDKDALLCLLGAAALRQTKTCGTCRKGRAITVQRKTQIECRRFDCLMSPGDGCRNGWTPKAPPVAEGETTR